MKTSTLARLLNMSSGFVLTVNGCLLAASGGAHAQSLPASSEDVTQGQVQVEPCDSPWNSTTAYEAGNVVSFGGRNYSAAYGTQGNAPSESSGAEESGQPWRPGLACVQVRGAAQENPDTNFSPSTLTFLKEKTGLDAEQWNNIMKLVNKPEQDSLDWTKYYGYCENIKDDRGYTIGIFGATTGGPNDTGPDAPDLFKEYDAIKGARIPSAEGGLARVGAHGRMSGAILKITDDSKAFCGKIATLQHDADWREAMWRTFYNVDIQYSVEQARQRGFDSALTIGSFVDTALNQGASGDQDSLDGLLHQTEGADEKTFLKHFYAARLKVVNTHQFNQSPNGTYRVRQWSRLLAQGQMNLKRADGAVVKVTGWTMH